MDEINARIQKRLLRTSKATLQSLGLCRVGKPVAFWVVGCQRSGTTMLLDAFEHDRRTRVYYEWDSRLFDPSLRLKEGDLVARRLARDSTQIVVTKPLLDSQWADELLRTHPQVHAIWIYRHYSAVVASNLRFFRQANGRRNLAPIIRSDRGDWRGERIAPDTLETIRSLVDQNCSDEDAAAMFWFARNSHFFDAELDRHPRAFLCNYEDIVQNPVRALSEIYDAVGIARPGPGIASEVHQNAGQGSSVRLSAPVDAVCRDLWTRLEAARYSQAASSAG